MSATEADADQLERNKEVVRQVVEKIWNQRDIDAADYLIAENSYDHDLGFDEQGGRAGFKQHVPDLWAGSSDLHLDIEFMIAERDLVAARVVWTGIHDGPMLGVPASYNRVEFRQLIVYRIENGMVAEIWKAGDVLGLLEEMGVPSPNRTTPLGMVKFVGKMIGRETYRGIRKKLTGSPVKRPET